MNWLAPLANTLWAASCLPAWQRFGRALREPGAAQSARLRRLLRRNANTDFGKAHGFAEIASHGEFARRVPLADYDAFQPWIDRIRRGEPRVLTHEPVTHLIPTSGTTSARKLIPFTAGLQCEFNAAIGPWLVDLARQHPGVLGGAAYWSVSPVLPAAAGGESAVPIGFDSDAAYLGGARRRLVDAVLAVPAETRHLPTLDAWRYATLLGLLRRRDLRLISIWNPSFLTLLLDALPACWDDLLRDVAAGTCRHAADFPPQGARRGAAKPAPGRAAELGRLNPHEPEALWPELRVISCWGDAAAALALPALGRRFPRTSIQAKGLLATEAFVSIPFGGTHPLALTSHYFEFLDDAGRSHPADALAVGAEYETVVSTSGGLWRYRLGDRVRVTGKVGNTPAIEFLGRTGQVSDVCGEKLSEAFATAVLRETFAAAGVPATACEIAAEQEEAGWRYVVQVEDGRLAGCAEEIDRALMANPHYALCRRLGQLLPLRVGDVTPGPQQRQPPANILLGAAKPCVLGPRRPLKRSASAQTPG